MVEASKLVTGIALLALLYAPSADSTAYARGFGGGGFRGGGYSGGLGGGRAFDQSAGRDIDRGSLDQGAMGDRGDWGDRGWQSRDDFGDRSDSGFGDTRADRAGDGFRDDDTRSWADHDWNTAATEQRQLATDGGFGRVMSSADLKSYTRPGNFTSPISRVGLANRASAVRNSFNRYDAFNGNWWARHHDAWYYPWWDGYAWGITSWAALAPFWGVAAAAAPIEYDYGNNITYEGDTVYYGSQPAASASDYYDQAVELAESAPAQAVPTSATQVAEQPAQQKKDWKPFGVFSLVQPGQTNSTTLFQIAVNKNGAIRGNYYNMLTDDVKPISGAVDKKTMRACWAVSGNKSVVYDTGVSNLLKPQSPILVHFAKEKTQEWLLVRQEKSGKRQA